MEAAFEMHDKRIRLWACSGVMRGKLECLRKGCLEMGAARAAPVAIVAVLVVLQLVRLGVGAMVILVDSLRTEGVRVRDDGGNKRGPVRGVIMVSLGVTHPIFGVAGTGGAMPGLGVAGTIMLVGLGVAGTIVVVLGLATFCCCCCFCTTI